MTPQRSVPGGAGASRCAAGFLLPRTPLLSWCCDTGDGPALGETHGFAAQWRWHCLELGEGRELLQEHSCVLHNDLFCREMLSTARALQPRDGTESQNHRMFGVGRDLCGSPSPTPCQSRVTYSGLHRTTSREGYAPPSGAFMIFRVLFQQKNEQPQSSQ